MDRALLQIGMVELPVAAEDVDVPLGKEPLWRSAPALSSRIIRWIAVNAGSGQQPGIDTPGRAAEGKQLLCRQRFIAVAGCAQVANTDLAFAVVADEIAKSLAPTVRPEIPVGRRPSTIPERVNALLPGKIVRCLR